MSDYGVPVPPQLVFDVGVSSLCTDIPTTDDGVYEENELFTVSLLSRGNVNVSHSITTVIITNDDCKCLIQKSFLHLLVSLYSCRS